MLHRLLYRIIKVNNKKEEEVNDFYKNHDKIN